MKEFDAQNIAVYALSYDEADALRDFRDAHDISYTLLTDPQSDVIKTFGILNTLIDADDHPWYGIPYPGTYVVSADGDITHKFFDNNLAVRAGPEQLLNAVLGRAAIGHSEPAAAHSEPDLVQDVEVSVQLAGPSLTPTVQRDLVALFRVPDGSHVYASPAPQGSIAVDVILDPCEGLVQRPTIRPQAQPHKLAGTDEVFDVYHHIFELRIPLTVNSAARGEVTLSGQVVWQACDDEVCGIPVRQRFEVTVPVSASPHFALGSKDSKGLEPNAMTHFMKMSQRRKKD
jgi:hypothetical protein